MSYAYLQRLSGALALALLLPASSAFAGGFSAARFGGERAHPTSDHPTVIYYNPAGLSLGSGTRIYGEGLFALRLASYERPEGAIDHVTDSSDPAAGTPSDATDVNAGKGELNDFLASPFLGAVSDFGVPNFAAGIALYAPFGGQSSWEQNDEFANDQTYPGAVDGVQRWHVIEGALRVLYVSGAASYHVPTSRLSLGASVSLVSTSVETLRGRTAAGTDDVVGPGGELLEGRSLVEVSGLDVAVGVGAIWQPVDKMYIGLSYQSQPGFKDQKLKGKLTNKFGAGAMDQSDIYFNQGMPDVVRAGVRYRVDPRLELRLQGDFQRWSNLENQCLTSMSEDAKCVINDDGSLGEGGQSVIVNIRRSWEDTFGLRAGGSWWAQPGLEVGGSLAYDSSAVPDETIDPALMDMDKLIGTASVRYEVNSDLALTGTFLHVVYFDRDVDVRNRDADGEPMGFDQPSRAPDGGGTYKNMVSAVSIAAEYAF